MGLTCLTVGVGVGEEALVIVVAGDIVLKWFELGGEMYASGDVMSEGEGAMLLLGYVAGGVSSSLIELSPLLI